MSEKGEAELSAVIGWGEARRLAGDDDELLGELVELFPTESAKHLANAKRALLDGDADAFTRAAHTLKSSARFFGAEALVECALAMEKLGRAENLTDAEGGIATLEAATQQVVDALALGPPAAQTGRESDG